MSSIKKAGIVATSTFAMVAGFSMAAAPAFANTCTPPVSVVQQACVDVEPYDADPGHAGFGVRAAAAVWLQAGGDTVLCTGTQGAGVNIDPTYILVVKPDLFTTAPLDCT